MFIHLQDLLRTALTVEEERERETQKLEKKLQLAELTHQQREDVWLKEMTQGILDGGGEERDDDIGEVEGEKNIIISKRPVRAEDRKTKKQRRKERERKTEVRVGMVIIMQCCALVSVIESVLLCTLVVVYHRIHHTQDKLRRLEKLKKSSMDDVFRCV